MQPPLELWTQTIICLDLVGEQSVSACCRRIENIEKRSAGWLVLIRYVRMPSDGICPCFENVQSSVVFCTTMNQVYFWVALRGTTGGMNMQTPKVGPKIQSFLDAKVG